MFRVLLVDDEAYFRQGLKELIDWEKLGFVISAETDNGEDALAMMLAQLPDVVITDIRMPVMDGLGLIHQAVQEHRLPVKFIIVSGYDEFNYAQQAIRYGVCDFLLKPIDESALEQTLLVLRETLEREAEERLREQNRSMGDMIAMCIQGSHTEEQLNEWQYRFEQQRRLPFYYLLIEENEPEMLFNMEQSPSMDQLRQHIYEVCERYFPGLIPLPLYEHRRQLGIMIAAQLLPDPYTIDQFAVVFQQKLQRRHAGEVYVYIGEQVRRLSELRHAYATAKESTMYKYVEHNRSVFLYEGLQEVPLRYMLMDTQYFHALSDAIEEQQEEKLLETIAHIFDHFNENRYVPEAVRTSLHRCVSNTLTMLGRMEANVDQMIYRNAMITWYDRNLTRSTLKQLFTAFVMECAGLAASQRKELSKGGIQKIKKYIDANYTTKINLKTVAAQYYMSPVYLGQLFRKTYGVYFNHYLLQLRVAEAKRLLRQTDLRVYEVADRIGFNNTEYFVSQFEKMEKITPSEYRALLME